jgi:hypothetical protein
MFRREIGWSQEATNTWYVAKAIEQLIGVSGASLTTGEQTVNKPFSDSAFDFTTLVSSVSTTVTVQGLIPASGDATLRNYITSLTINTDALGAAGLLWILNGALTVTSVATGTGLATTSTAHDLKVGDSVVFTALAGGTGLSTNTIYYVRAVPSPTTFNFSTTILGANTVPSVAYTGTTCYQLLFQFRLQTAAIGVPTTITFPTPLRGALNVNTNFLIPTSMTSGTIYLTANGYRAV